MESKEGKKIYALRKITVEPVIGHIKEVFGFRKFLLRGLEGVRVEFNIVSLSHNLKKIYLARVKGSGNSVVFYNLSFIVGQVLVLSGEPARRASGVKRSDSKAQGWLQ